MMDPQYDVQSRKYKEGHSPSSYFVLDTSHCDTATGGDA